jgi:glycerol-3-phosphate dehydrogenase
MTAGPQARRRNIEELRTGSLDVLVIGGGINGAGVARDLALRSHHAGAALRIGLVEQRHFASGTSGKNSQLIHGGLRYLKYLQFGMVRESLRERALLLQLAPHLVEPLPLLIPMFSSLDRFYYGAGLCLYDLLAGSRNISKHRRLSGREVAETEPGLSREGLSGGAIFFDCRVHSARFVLENILDAARLGAIIVNYVRAVELRRESGQWRVSMENALSGERFEATAREIVDATGPWSTGAPLRLVRGSHLILPRITTGERAIAHFDEDGRIVFLIPWGSHSQLTLVGTTDVDHESGPDDVEISPEETAYLLRIVRALFPGAAGVEPVSTFSSLRPLLRDGSGSPVAASREHRIWRSDDGIVRIAGGKYTTYRAMSEEAADLALRNIAPELARLHVTADAPFPPPEGRRIEDLPVEAQASRVVNCEMAQRLPDLLFVSTYIGYERSWDQAALRPFAEAMAIHLGWDERRVQEEIDLALRLCGRPSAGTLRT